MIRIAIEEDISRILEIERDSITPPWPHGALLSEIYSDDAYFAVWDNRTAPTSHAPFAHEGGGPQGRGLSPVHAPPVLGFIILRSVADEGELFQIAVDSSYRRRGLADDLIEAALDWAGNKNINSIYLEVRKSNEAAIALYVKHGFMQVGYRKEYFTEPVEDAIIMRMQK